MKKQNYKCTNCKYFDAKFNKCMYWELFCWTDIYEEDPDDLELNFEEDDNMEELLEKRLAKCQKCYWFNKSEGKCSFGTREAVTCRAYDNFLFKPRKKEAAYMDEE